MSIGPASPAYQRLQALPRFGNGPGLHRMAALCGPELHDPWLGSVDAIRVTGSNGKGSVCAIAAALLQAFGLRTGLYTSPHLTELNERLMISGAPIGDEALEDALGQALDHVDAYLDEHPSDQIARFEALTCTAIIHMTRERPQALVIEAGIGGRLDSTRVFPGTTVGLSSLDLEHTAVLGSSLELIAQEKADLCPDGGQVICGRVDDEICRRLAGSLATRRASLVRARDLCRPRNVEPGRRGTRLDLELDGRTLHSLELALVGRHQVDNAALAVALVSSWLQDHAPGLLTERLEQGLRSGMAAARSPGRFECIRSSPEVWIDVGHTPAAIEALLDTAREVLSGRRVLLVTGVSVDKEVEMIVSRLVAVADEVICTRAHHKGSPAERILEICTARRPEVTAWLEPDISAAMSRAIEHAQAHDMAVLVAGGLFLAVEARHALAGLDPRTLDFL